MPKRAAASPPRGRPRVSVRRRRPVKEMMKLVKPGIRVALTTHVNADGDGVGSEVALWHFLTARGARAAIANPTPFPERFRFLLEGQAAADKTEKAVKHLERADVIMVLDIADVGRLGHLGRIVERSRVPVICIDHHVSDGSLPAGPRLVDPDACATGELVYDLARIAGWPITLEAARALYVAILTDTGGFRFSNTSPRALQIGADLLAGGVDPEAIYRDVYACESEGKIRLLGETLETLVVESSIGLAWMTIPPRALERYGVDAADLDGIVEMSRSIRGIRLALLFRALASGRVKVSFRSVGDVDVAQLAERFGGGGHRKAAGASFDGSLPEVQARVLEAARNLLSRASVAHD